MIPIAANRSKNCCANCAAANFSRRRSRREMATFCCQLSRDIPFTAVRFQWWAPSASRQCEDELLRRLKPKSCDLKTLEEEAITMSEAFKPSTEPWYRRIKPWQFSLRTLLVLMAIASGV